MSIAPQEPAHTAPVFQPCTLVASGSHSWWLPHVESKDDRKCVQRGFSPDLTDILSHVFAFLALNRIAHLLLHILTPDKSYDPPLPYFKLLCRYTLLSLALTCPQWWSGILSGTFPQQSYYKQPEFHRNTPPLPRRGKPSKSFWIIHQKKIFEFFFLISCQIRSEKANRETVTLKICPTC